MSSPAHQRRCQAPAATPRSATLTTGFTGDGSSGAAEQGSGGGVATSLLGKHSVGLKKSSTLPVSCLPVSVCSSLCASGALLQS